MAPTARPHQGNTCNSIGYQGPRPKARPRTCTACRPVNALEISYDMLATDDLVSPAWGVVGSSVCDTTLLDGECERVLLRELSAATAPKRFFRLRLTFSE